MNFLRTAVLAVGMMSLVACGGSSDTGDTVPAAQPCGGDDMNPCDNPCGDDMDSPNPCGDDMNPCEGENPCGEATGEENPCGEAANPCG